MTLAALALLFASASASMDLPPGLLAAVCRVESGYNVKALHPNDGGATSIGVCQIKLQTARGMGFQGTEKQLASPQVNIQYAARYLGYQLYRYNGDIIKAVAAYNAGKHRPGRDGKPKNHRYVAKVFVAWSEVHQ